MIYQYKNEYYILRSRRLRKVIPVLTESGGLTFEAADKILSIEEINIIDCKEVSAEDIKKELNKPIKIEKKVILAEKPLETKKEDKPIKINKFDKVI